jgi:hypothetical protein
MEIGGILVGLGTGSVGILLTWWRYRKKDSAETRKTDAETAKLEAEATEVMIRNLQSVIVRCQDEMKRMEALIAELRIELFKAQEKLNQRGI